MASKQRYAANRRRIYRKPTRSTHASKVVRWAILAGYLARPSICARADGSCSGPIEAHHADYDKPLDVEWLCVSHHKRHHHPG